MSDERPDPDQVWKAIDVYMADAYANQQPPATVRSLIALLKAWVGPLLNAPPFVKGGDATRPRYSLRLGNHVYPHMKLVVEPGPNSGRYLFKADTHDRHVCPPQESPEFVDFRKLMDENQRLSERIETDWSAQGLPTFKAMLREDLARRQASAS
ncbi:MAG: hypothetical protein WBD40_07625 [Tepidisphaeraceae bacterium]